jgi:hypothetical protein
MDRVSVRRFRALELAEHGLRALPRWPMASGIQENRSRAPIPPGSELRPFGEELPCAHNRITVDEKSFPNASEKNPTLTMLAMSWRATDYLADQIKAGAL